MRRLLLLALALCGTFPLAARAEELPLAIVRTAAAGPVFIALDKGYFAAEGFDAALVPFVAPEPVSVAVVTGNAAFGVAALTAGFYSLAARGELRLIGGESRDRATYRNICILASHSAVEAGLWATRQLGGHSLAMTQLGAPGHYAIARLAEKDGFDLSTIRIVALQSYPNIVSALAGGEVDAGMLPAAPCVEAAEKGEARLLGWTGDAIEWQVGGIFTTAFNADDRPDLVKRFLKAYRRGARDYYAAFSGPDGARADGPGTDAALAIIAKYTGEAPQHLRQGIAYVDPEARIDRADVLRQIAWYRAQHLLKGDIDGAAIVDERYVGDQSAR
jgi:NitT/TauT family transport system substrate-binding protein